MGETKEPQQSVQVFGRKKTATAVAYCKRGKGLIKVGFYFNLSIVDLYRNLKAKFSLRFPSQSDIIKFLYLGGGVGGGRVPHLRAPKLGSRD